MNLFLFANKVYNKLSKANQKLSFAQCGEDCILLFLIHSLKLKNVTYFDFGTNDPRSMNNTYLLYINKYRGVCVEPDPYFHSKIKRYRPEDVLITNGVSVTNEEQADFYMMDDPLLNTFSASEAENLVKNHQRTIKRKAIIGLTSINDIFEQYYVEKSNTIVSLDVEGFDFLILQSLNFSKYRPAIICVESIEYSTNLSGMKNTRISSLLTDNNYFLYADTHINSIFVDRNLIENS